MALKQDERALLQLVCERGQSYEDIAGLLGISEPEVRAKARGALAELGGADPDAEVGLTDYLLGQADPIGRADAVRHLQQSLEAREFAGDVLAKLRVLAPGAELPSIPEPGGRRRRPAEAPRDEGVEGRRRPKAPVGPRSQRQSRMIAGIAGAGVLLVFAILGIAGVFGGDDEGVGEDPAEAQRETTVVTLNPRGGSGVAGQATVGTTETVVFIDLEIEGLDPELSRDRVYFLWLIVEGNAGLPLATPIVPNANGRFQDRLPIPGPQLELAFLAQRMEIVSSPVEALGKAIESAAEAGSPVVAREGEVVARGNVPIAAGAEIPEDADLGQLGSSDGEGAGEGGSTEPPADGS